MVKSPPELWAECSNAASLARHLGRFGEIRITKLEPETAVAWEGSAARGTVRLEPAGWGTKVFLTATEADVPGEPEPVAQATPEPVAQATPEPVPPEPEPEPEPPEPKSERPAEPQPAAEPEVAPAVRRGFFARLMARFQAAPLATELDAPPQPEPAPQPAPEPEPAAGDRAAAEAPPAANALDAALDSLGSAHHRPYSRA